MAKDRDKFIDDLEKVGEKEIRRRFIAGKYGHSENPVYSVVKGWLDSKEAVRKAASEARSEAREEESLSISRQANSIAEKARSEARRANIIAISAIILSTITAIIAASDKAISLLHWLGVLKP